MKRFLSNLLLLFIIFIFGCKKLDKMAVAGIKELEMGRVISALTIFEQCLEEEPNNAFALYGKGKIMVSKLVTVKIGISMLKEALKSNTLDIVYKQDIYLILSKILDNKEVLSLLSTALKNQENRTPQLYHSLAKSYMYAKDEASANKSYLTGLSFFKDNIFLYKSYFTYLINLQRYLDAKNIMLSLLQNDPNNKEYIENTISIFYILRDKNSSLEYINKVLSLNLSSIEYEKYTRIKNLIIKNNWKPTFTLY